MRIERRQRAQHGVGEALKILSEYKYGPLYTKFAAVELRQLSENAEARIVGQKLFLTYCSQCHASDARGAKGFPNLADRDWLGAGDPAYIKKTIMEAPILRRRDRTPTITVRGDIAEGLQPPDVSAAVWKELQPIIAKLPSGYRIEQGGSIEESGKANRALAPLFPIMERGRWLRLLQIGRHCICWALL